MDRTLETRTPAVRVGGLALAGVAGVMGPLLFVLLLLVQSFLAPDYSHVTEPISALSTRPYGWIQNANFAQFGVLLIVFALGLARAMPSGRRLGIAIAGFLLGGLGSLVLATFPWRTVNGAPFEPLGHTIGSFLLFLPIAIGYILLSWPMRADPRWRDLSSATRASGIAIIVLFFAFGALAEAKDTPLHSIEGIFQRVLAAVVVGATLMLGLRLIRIGRTAS